MSATEESDTRGQPVTVKLKADALFGKLGSGPFSLRGQKIIIIWIELSTFYSYETPPHGMAIWVMG